jgi:hypothetical protein
MPSEAFTEVSTVVVTYLTCLLDSIDYSAKHFQTGLFVPSCFEAMTTPGESKACGAIWMR